jgi:caa(3)-type oxidase subunit IV
MNNMDAHNSTHDAGAEHATHEGAYFLVFICLAALTLTELMATYVPAAVRYPLLIILMITKAYLVISFFMHLRWEKRFYPLIITFPVVVAALIALAVQQLVR